MQITHSEVVTAVGTGCAALVWFLGWWSRGPRVKSLDDAFDSGYTEGRADAREDREWEPDGVGHRLDDTLTAPRPDERQRGSEVAGPGRTIYPELAALGAESHAEPPEPVPVRLDETTEEWAARMDMKAAIWCAENGIERVGAS